MTTQASKITNAKESDLEEILELLRASSLPTDGVAEHLSDFFVARDAADRLVGCAAIERYGPIGLLRSVAVASELQKSGLGSRLVASLLSNAQLAGVAEVVLLTTTARDFFSRRFGFKETSRTPYSTQLAQSIEWRLPRCSPAVVMSLRLNKETST